MKIKSSKGIERSKSDYFKTPQKFEETNQRAVAAASFGSGFVEIDSNLPCTTEFWEHDKINNKIKGKKTFIFILMKLSSPASFLFLLYFFGLITLFCS